MSPLNKDLMYTPLDALTAGVSPDGLKSRLAIKAMICFLLDTLPEPLSKDDILDVMCGHELANYFEVCDGLDRLIRLGNVVILDEDGNPDGDGDNKNGGLGVSENGRKISRELSKNLPLTVREKGLAAAQKIIARRRSERENPVEITPEDGGCRFSCSVKGGGAPLMTLSLYLPDESYAEEARNRFHDAPDELYRAALAFLTGEVIAGGGQE